MLYRIQYLLLIRNTFRTIIKLKRKSYFLTYIRITRFGPTPILTPVTTKCIGVGSSHNSLFGKLEPFFSNVKRPLTAASTYKLYVKQFNNIKNYHYLKIK